MGINLALAVVVVGGSIPSLATCRAASLHDAVNRDGRGCVSLLHHLRVCSSLAALAALAALAVLASCASGTGGGATSDRVTIPTPAEFPAPDTVTGGRDGVLARADQAWQAEEYPAATVLYQEIVARDAPVPSVAIFRLATLRAWDNRLDEAVALYRRYMAMEPRDNDGRLALSRALAWKGDYSAALAIYDSVLVTNPADRDAVVGRAETLAWSGRFREALLGYQGWLAAHPSDRDASLSYARTLSWSGRLRDAETLYTGLAQTGDADAQAGLARVIGRRGDLARSERAWRQIIETEPNHAEALTGLAQVLRWQGRPKDAETALQIALRAKPGYGDARALLRLVRADLRPYGSVRLVSSDDIDRNRVTHLQVDYAARASWNGTLGARYTERHADLRDIQSRARSMNLSASWQPGASALRFGADAGVARLTSSREPSSGRPRPTLGIARVRVSGTASRFVTFGIGASRAPFDETALLISNRLVLSDIEGETAIALPARFSLSGGGGYARVTGGARDNARVAGSSTLRWTASRRWSVAVGARRFAYDTASADGYFAPRRYTLAEGSVRGQFGGDIGWIADADAALGTQSIQFFGSSGGSRRAERFAASAGYRFGPTREVSVAGTYANIAGPGQVAGGEYRAHSISLRARMGF